MLKLLDLGIILLFGKNVGNMVAKKCVRFLSQVVF